MKKNILTFAYVILIIVVLYSIQLYIINPRGLFGIKPNLLLIISIIISLWYGIYIGGVSSFLIGFITDIIFGSSYCIFTISYTIVGLIIGVINENYRKESKMSLVYVTLIASAIFEISQYFEYMIIYKIASNVMYLIKQTVISSLLNIVIVYIIYSIMYKISEYIDERINRNLGGL